MNLTEQVEQLKVVLPKLKSGDQKFAMDLMSSFMKYKKLSPKQEPWVGKLLERASAPTVAPDAVHVGNFDGVIALFKKAQASNLKYPKISLMCLGKKITLAVAGKQSKAPGSVNVMGEGKYPDREWFGRVAPTGEWTPSLKTSPEMLAALQALLTKFSAQPARVAKEHGKLTGHCCFCNSELTDAKSLAAGFGPVCADHYGLKTEWKLAVAKGELAAGTKASELASDVLTGDDTLVKELFEAPKVKCFFCEEPSSETTVLLGYTVCPKCAKQLV